MDGESLLEGLEAGVSDGYGVVAERDVQEGEGAFTIGVGGFCKGRVGCLQGDVSSRQRAVLGVVDDSPQLGEDAGVRHRD